MAQVKVTVKQEQIDAVYALLDGIKNGAERAIRTSLNRTLDGAVTLTAKKIGQKVTLKASMIKDHITKERATNYALGAAMRMQSRRMPLAAFSTTPSAANFQIGDKGNGVLVKVWKDRPSVRFRHAFFAIMPNGYIGLFNRRDSRRLPIDELVGPYLGSVYEETPGLAQEVEQTSAERLLRELESQTNYLLGLAANA